MAVAPLLPGVPEYPDPIVRDDGSWFENSLGVLSGRVQVGNEYLMVLGQLECPEEVLVKHGDYVEFTQSDVDLTGVDYITFPAQIIGRELADIWDAWTAYILVNGVVYATKNITPEKSMDWNDFRVPVALIDGEVDVTVRLMYDAPDEGDVEIYISAWRQFSVGSPEEESRKVQIAAWANSNYTVGDDVLSLDILAWIETQWPGWVRVLTSDMDLSDVSMPDIEFPPHVSELPMDETQRARFSSTRIQFKAPPV